jgi:hypothetical protein
MDNRQKVAFDNPIHFNSDRRAGLYRSEIQIDGLTVESFVTYFLPLSSSGATWCAELAAIDGDGRRIAVRTLSGRTQSLIRHLGCDLLDCVGLNDIRITELQESVRITRTASLAEVEVAKLRGSGVAAPA